MIKSQAHQLAPVLKAIFKEILELAGVGFEEKGREVYLHTIPHSLSEYKAGKRQHQKNTNCSQVWCDISSNWSKLLDRGQPYPHVFNYNFLLNFIFF